MRSSLLLVCLFLVAPVFLQAQDEKIILVKAGTKVIDYFPVSERYLYREFVPGRIVFRNGKFNDLSLNYNILAGEMEFLKSGDTLAISSAGKKEIRYVVAQDTFYYAGGYIQLLSGGELKVGLRQWIRVKDVLKRGAYGTTSRGASIDTYSTLATSGISYDLVPDADIELQKTLEYYISDQSGGFQQFTRKNVLQLFPAKEKEIKAFIKSEKIDFDSREDLLKFADYLRSLQE